MTAARATRATKRGAKLATALAPGRAAGWASSLRKLRFGLPLLTKELTELAARGRTYSVRTLYAAALFAVFAFMFYSDTARLAPSPTLLLGVGRQLLGYMFVAQLVGVYVFLPAMVSGCITEEKEKRTLELLFITDLTPGEIVMQKLVGRLVPMLTLLLLSLPLMAVCYSLGGLSSDEVLIAAAVLVTTCVQVGAFSVMMSAYSRTSSEALLRTYGHAILLYIAVWFVAGIAGLILRIMLGPLGAVPWLIAAGLMPPLAMGIGWGNPFISIALLVAAWGWSAVFLWRARRYLVERAFLQPKRRKYSFFGGMVRYARREAARRRKRGQNDTSYLPAAEPILWRDTTNTYLDWPHGFRGALGLTMFAVCFFALPSLLAGFSGQQSAYLSFLVSVLWIIAAGCVTARSSNAFALERANQTLEVLLSTPMSGEEIVRQKMKVSWRLALFFAVPLVTLVAAEALVEFGRFGILHQLTYLAVATASVFVFLPAFAWVSLFVGLRVRDARRATLLALGAVFIWNAGPVALMATATWFTRADAPGRILLLALPSPAFVIGLLEHGSVGPSAGTMCHLLAAAGLALNVAMLFAIRRLCLKNADRYLGRPAAPGATADVPAAAVTVEGGVR